MYKNFVFDLYGTLLDIRTNENKPYLWKKMSDIYTAMGAKYSAAELRQSFWELEEQQVLSLPKNGELDLGLVFAELFYRKGVDCDKSMVKSTAITFRVLSRSKLCVYDGVHDALRGLKENGRKVYLLSNAQTYFTRPEITMTGLGQYFDGILISSEVGFKKPAPEFYAALLDGFSLKPEESLMVGNDEISDIAGAICAGMDALYIHTEISPQEPVQGLATYSVMDGDWRKVAALLANLQKMC